MALYGEEQPLRIYLSYTYLPVSQLAWFLTSLDDLYNTVYPALAESALLPLGPETGLQIRQANTGNSILLELADGIRQVLSLSGIPVSTVGGGGIAIALGFVVCKAMKEVAETRKSWHEGSKAKYEVKKLRYQEEQVDQKRHSQQLGGGEAQSMSLGAPIDLAALPIAVQEQVREKALLLVVGLQDAENITSMRVQDELIIDRGYTNK